MTVQRTAAVGFWIMIASTVAMGQQRDDRIGPDPNAPGETVVLRTFPSGNVQPSRIVETRSNSGDRQLIIETTEMPDLDGRLAPTRQTTTETNRARPGETRHEVFGFIPPDQRLLLETTESEQETLPDGTIRTVWNTLAPDLNGRLGVTAREIQHTTAIAPDVKQTDTAIFLPGINESLLEVERLQQTERQINPDVHRVDGARFVRDANGRFQPAESWSQEVRATGSAEYLREDTIHRLDFNGKMTVSERVVTHGSQDNGRDETVTEVFSRDLPGVSLYDNRLELSQRLRVTTTSAPDGSRQTIEELEERVPGSLSEPIRLVQRTIGTTSRIDADHWQTERRLYALDANGRLVLAIDEAGEATGR